MIDIFAWYLPFFLRGQGRSKIGCRGFCSRNFFHRLSLKTTKTSAQSKTPKRFKGYIVFLAPRISILLYFLLSFANYHKNRHSQQVNNFHFSVLRENPLKFLNLMLCLMFAYLFPLPPVVKPIKTIYPFLRCILKTKYIEEM